MYNFSKFLITQNMADEAY